MGAALGHTPTAVGAVPATRDWGQVSAGMTDGPAYDRLTGVAVCAPSVDASKIAFGMAAPAPGPVAPGVARPRGEVADRPGPRA
jgi:hypothetical protein